MTGQRKITNDDYRKYTGMEQGLIYGHKKYISINKNQAQANQEITECVIRKLIKLMLRESPAFASLYVDTFGAGSSYEGLKISSPDEFDIDILMRLPEVTQPCLLENNIPGYVNLQLNNFQALEFENPDLYKVMQTFVDEKNYLLTKEMKGSFMQSIFDRTVSNYFPDNIIRVGRRKFKIRVQSLGPAFTLTVEGHNFRILVDLVPCVLLDGNHWPGNAFKPNPYDDPSDFFLVPKSPKKELPHIERYWRLSFQKQEKDIIFDRQWMKPTIRILKRIRDHFGHKVSSYALKTIFFRELEVDNPELDDDVPDLWLAPWSYCVVYMLEVYLKYLQDGKIPYFWNKNLNLLDNLTEGQIEHYSRDIESVLDDIKDDTVPDIIIKYLEAVKI